MQLVGSLSVWQFFGDLNLDTILSGDTANCTVSVSWSFLGLTVRGHVNDA
jgi:hypothetical protein